jgi:transcriptional regulator with XRE-family HTH domain
MEAINDEILIKKIGAAFKKVRQKKKLSQEEVYNDTNINISRVERAIYNMKISSISALCKYFDIKLSDFFKMVESE